MAKSIIFPVLLVFYEIATYLSNDMYLPALPQMMNDLGLSSKQAQLTLTSWFIGQAAMPLIIGVLSDRCGRRPVLLIGGIVYILSTMVCATTSDPYTLLLARFIEGGMIAAMMVPGYACIHELYDKIEAIRILAFMGSISVLAPALGPLFGSIVLSVLSWRWIFWIIALWATLAILLLYKWMPETLPREKRQPIDLALLSHSYWRVLTNKNYMVLMFVLGLVFAGFLAWITASPLLVIESFEYSAITFGIIQVVIFAVYIFGNRCVKYLLDSIGVNALIRLGFVISTIGATTLLVVAYLFPNNIYPFIFCMMIYSLGAALSFSPLNRSIIEASQETMGVRVALFTVFLSCFAALGSALATLVFDGSLLSLAYIILSVIIIASLLKATLNTRVC